MRLLTVGDSFTYGEELSDLTNAWPNLLAKKLECELTNLARPGGGNTRMVRHCVEQVNTYDFAIIAWSHFARIEMADDIGFYDLWPGCSELPHQQFSPWRGELIKYFSRNFDDDYLYRQYLLNIILIQNFFKANNKRYLMLDTFGNHQTNQRTLNSNKDLLNQIDPLYYIGWPEKSMMEWTYGCAKGLYGHFLDEGHKRVADKVYEHIRNLGWLP